MRGFLHALVVFTVAANRLLASQFQNLECTDELIENFNDPQKDFCDRSYFFSFNGQQYQGFDKITCQLLNDLTLHIYQEDSKFVVEVKGFQNPETEIFSSCKNISKAIQKWSKLEKQLFTAPQVKKFSNSESVLLVASENNCSQLSSPLNTWLQIFKNEGRSNSNILCVPQAVIDTQNPSSIRTYIHQNLSIVSGLILVGNDIPPFEYFYDSGYQGEDYADFRYGATDLAYGDLTSKFWSHPLSKLDSSIRNIIYHDEGFSRSTQLPTQWTFNLGSWVSSVRKGNETPLDNKKLWVSRWIATKDQQLLALKSFTLRREKFKPFMDHRYLFAQGGSGILFSPHNTEQSDKAKSMMAPFIEKLPHGSFYKILTGTHLFGLSRYLDRNITFASYEEHGNSIAIGELKATKLPSIDWLPPIFHVDSCSTGEWFASELIETFMNQLMSISHPPLITIASQGINWLPTIGTPDSITSEIFFNDFKKGQNFGNRQIETFQKNLQNWIVNHPEDLNAAYPSQLFLALSLFGDGTIEF